MLPNKAMEPTDHGQCSQGLFEAMQKRWRCTGDG